MTQTHPANHRVISGLGSQDEARPTPLDVLKLDERTYNRSLDCVHCGLCLPACPTYTTNGLEADSPRGRIYLMKGLADGKVELTDSVVKHLDLCLDCQACETACPSGVKYHELIEETREHITHGRKFGLVDRIIRAVFFHVFTQPTRLKLAMVPARIMQKIGLWKLLSRSGVMNLLPAQLNKMQQMLPSDGPLWEESLADRYPATGNLDAAGKARATVAVFPGCVGSVLFQDVNRQMVRILQHIGCDVVVPRGQGCCGAIHHHAGDSDGARQFARANIDAVLPRGAARPTVDYIVNNIAGCGAALKDYHLLLRDDPNYADRAVTYVSHVKDISELLVKLDPPRPTHRVEKTVTYHQACHLAHAQKVTEPPMQVLRWIEGLSIKPLVESDMCCGAAGTYNLSQPQMARDLADRKIKHIQATQAGTCVTGNVGCAMQIQSEADRIGVPLTTQHPVTLLHEAYFGTDCSV